MTIPAQTLKIQTAGSCINSDGASISQTPTAVRATLLRTAPEQRCAYGGRRTRNVAQDRACDADCDKADFRKDKSIQEHHDRVRRQTAREIEREREQGTEQRAQKIFRQHKQKSIPCAEQDDNQKDDAVRQSDLHIGRHRQQRGDQAFHQKQYERRGEQNRKRGEPPCRAPHRSVSQSSETILSVMRCGRQTPLPKQTLSAQSDATTDALPSLTSMTL